jgi:tetratricopeptide (TPR) repeat protein
MGAGSSARQTSSVNQSVCAAMSPLLDARGLAVSTPDAVSLTRFEAALASLHASRGDALELIDAALARDAGFAAGHCLRAAALIMASEAPHEPALAGTIRATERLGDRANDRERRHAAAARAWLEGDARLAAERYGELVIDYPRDSLALQLAHTLDFRLSQREMLRDRAAQVLPHWDESVPGFGFVLGLYAFGLEETGDYARAEAVARRSLDVDPANASAIHVIAHVMEMQGRTHEGIKWLESTRKIWESNAGFAVHSAWHLALFRLDLDETEAALRIYDRMLAPTADSPIGTLVDATALLWRLEIRGLDVRARWRALADCWSRKPLAGRRAFNLVHAVIAFTAAGRPTAARRVAELLRNDAATRSANSADDLTLAVPLTEALQAFGCGDYARAVERISVVRAIAHRCGGSLAQCDLIHLTFVEAALRSRRRRLAEALAAERTARKPQSPLNQWLFARAADALATLPVGGVHETCYREAA